MNEKKKTENSSLWLLVGVLIVIILFLWNDREKTYNAGFEKGRLEGYSAGCEDTEWSAEDEVRERMVEFVANKNLYYFDEATDAELNEVIDNPLYEYCLEEYAIEVSEYFDNHKGNMTPDQQKAFEGLINWGCEAERLLTKLLTDRIPFIDKDF